MNETDTHYGEDYNDEENIDDEYYDYYMEEGDDNLQPASRQNNSLNQTDSRKSKQGFHGQRTMKRGNKRVGLDPRATSISQFRSSSVILSQDRMLMSKSILNNTQSKIGDLDTPSNGQKEQGGTTKNHFANPKMSLFSNNAAPPKKTKFNLSRDSFEEDISGEASSKLSQKMKILSNGGQINVQDDSISNLDFGKTLQKNKVQGISEDGMEGYGEGMIIESESQSQLMKPLIFGLNEEMQYTYHKNQVKQFIINQNNQLFVTADDKQIHFWSMLNGQKKKHIHLPEYLKSHSAVSTIAYSHKYRIYLLVTVDFKFFFFNEVYNIVKHLDMSSIRLVNFAHFYDQKNQLITAGIDGVFIFEFSYSGKYEPFQASQIDPEGKSIKIELKNKTILEGMPIWAKGMKIDEENNLIICWDHLNLTFHELHSTSHKLINCYKNLLTEHQANPSKISDANQDITDILMFQEYRYFVTGTTLGHLMVWKQSHKKKLIHKYEGHFREIGSLSKHPSGDESMFMSFSLDGTVKIWSLDKFNMLYQFNLPQKLTLSRFFNKGTKVLAAQGSKIVLNDLYLTADTFMLPPDVEVKQLLSSCQPIQDPDQQQQNYKIQRKESIKRKQTLASQLRKVQNISGLSKSNKRLSQKDELYDQQNYLPFQLILCEDNSVFIQDTLSHKVISTIFPPPTAQQTVSLFHSCKMNRLIVLLITGSLCIYQFDKETALLEKILQPHQLRDSEGKGVGSQKIMCTRLIRCEKRSEWISPIDQDIFNEKIHQNSVQNYLKDEEENQEYIAFGMSKGSLFIVNTQKLDQIYVRLTISRASVRFINYIPEKQLFVSICDEQILKVWSIDQNEHKMQVYYNFPCYRSISHITNLSYSHFVISFESGDFEIFCLNLQHAMVRRLTLNPSKQLHQVKQFQVYKVETDKGKEHDSSLTGIDFHPLMNLLVTSCQEGVIKVWKMPFKHLVKEIKFPAKIDSVCFRNKQSIITRKTSRNNSKIRGDSMDDESNEYDVYNSSSNKNSETPDDYSKTTITYCGDVLVAHEKRVSILKYETYCTQEDSERLQKLEDERGGQQPARTEITEQMFHQMMLKENEIRGVSITHTQNHSKQQNSKLKSPQDIGEKKEMQKVPVAKLNQQQTPKMSQFGNGRSGDINGGMMEDKPKSPMTLRAEWLFQRIDKIKQKNQEKKPNPIKLDYLEQLQKREYKPEEIKISDEEMLKFMSSIPSMVIQDRSEEAHQLISEALKINASQLQALPPLKTFGQIKKQRVFLTQTNRFTHFPMTQPLTPQQSSFMNLTQQNKRLTRRDITTEKITANILKYNSPTAQKQFKNLRLGPLPNLPQPVQQQYLQQYQHTRYNSLYKLDSQNNIKNQLNYLMPTHQAFSNTGEDSAYDYANNYEYNNQSNYTQEVIKQESSLDDNYIKIHQNQTINNTQMTQDLIEESNHTSSRQNIKIIPLQHHDIPTSTIIQESPDLNQPSKLSLEDRSRLLMHGQSNTNNSILDNNQSTQEGVKAYGQFNTNISQQFTQEDMNQSTQMNSHRKEERGDEGSGNDTNKFRGYQNTSTINTFNNNSPINYRSTFKLEDSQIGLNFQNQKNGLQMFSPSNPSGGQLLKNSSITRQPQKNYKKIKHQRMQSFVFPSTHESSIAGQSQIEQYQQSVQMIQESSKTSNLNLLQRIRGQESKLPKNLKLKNNSSILRPDHTLNGGSSTHVSPSPLNISVYQYQLNNQQSARNSSGVNYLKEDSVNQQIKGYNPFKQKMQKANNQQQQQIDDQSNDNSNQYEVQEGDKNNMSPLNYHQKSKDRSIDEIGVQRTRVQQNGLYQGNWQNITGGAKYNQIPQNIKTLTSSPRINN